MDLWFLMPVHVFLSIWLQCVASVLKHCPFGPGILLGTPRICISFGVLSKHIPKVLEPIQFLDIVTIIINYCLKNLHVSMEKQYIHIFENLLEKSGSNIYRYVNFGVELPENKNLCVSLLEGGGGGVHPHTGRYVPPPCFDSSPNKWLQRRVKVLVVHRGSSWHARRGGGGGFS